MQKTHPSTSGKPPNLPRAKRLPQLLDPIRLVLDSSNSRRVPNYFRTAPKPKSTRAKCPNSRTDKVLELPWAITNSRSSANHQSTREQHLANKRTNLAEDAPWKLESSRPSAGSMLEIAARARHRPASAPPSLPSSTPFHTAPFFCFSSIAFLGGKKGKFWHVLTIEKYRNLRYLGNFFWNLQILNCMLYNIL